MSSAKRRAADDPDISGERKRKPRRPDGTPAASHQILDMPYMPLLYRHGPWSDPDEKYDTMIQLLDLPSTSVILDWPACQNEELLSFCPADEHGSPTGKRAKASKKKVDMAKKEIANTIRFAMQRINELHRSIQEENFSLLPALTEDSMPGQFSPFQQKRGYAVKCKAWYWKADIMTLDTEYVKELFKRCPIKDVMDFGEYLELTVPGAYEPAYFRRQESPELDMEEKVDEVNHKMWNLYHILNNFPDPAARRAAVSFILHLMTSLAAEHVYDDRSIVGGARWSMYTILFSRLEREIASKNTDYYFDFAALRRHMWFEWDPIGAQYARPTGEELESCFHEFIRPLLQYIHKLAHREIRARTYLAVGSHLPAELADLVVEASLTAEEVPLELDIYEKDKVLREDYRCWCAESRSASPE